MSLVFAALIEVVTLLCSGGIMFAGMMRASGSDSGDKRSAITMLICGSVVASLVAASHWLGW